MTRNAPISVGLLTAALWTGGLLGAGLLALAFVPAPAQALGAVAGLLAPWVLGTVLEHGARRHRVPSSSQPQPNGRAALPAAVCCAR